jgi:hypothetical protein
MDIEEAVRELKCLLVLNNLASRTEYKSLLNENLDRRKQALQFLIDYASHPKKKVKIGELGILPEPIQIYNQGPWKAADIYNKLLKEIGEIEVEI